MGIIRCFARIACALHQGKVAIDDPSLEKIAIQYEDYAYIGDRKTLEDAVRERARRLRDKLRKGTKAQDIPQEDDDETWARWWFGKSDWKKDSGVYPDFVLAFLNDGTFGDGGLLELKDSAGGAIASFNSTLPSARKLLSEEAPLVWESVCRYDLPVSLDSSYPSERAGFYLVRTNKQSGSRIRLSVVQGTFFETLPTSELLTELWRQVLGESQVAEIVSEDVLDEILRALGSLKREEVAITRHIPGASVKPRLRIMSEIEEEGNPHTYAEILPRSINLVVKPPAIAEQNPDWLEQASEWFAEEASKDRVNVALAIVAEGIGKMRLEQCEMSIRLLSIKHKRNGLHLVVQTVLPT